jgi:hypothetical protein
MCYCGIVKQQSINYNNFLWKYYSDMQQSIPFGPNVVVICTPVRKYAYCAGALEYENNCQQIIVLLQCGTQNDQFLLTVTRLLG